MSGTTDCLIQQTRCGRIAGNPICPKCGASEQMLYTTEDAMILAKAQAIARYWQSESEEFAPRGILAAAERLLKAKERLEMDQSHNAVAPTLQADEEIEEAPALMIFQDQPIAPQMVLLASGSFLMGSADPKAVSSEHPQHEVTIAYKLAIGCYQVTFEEWDTCVADGGSSHKPDDHGWGRGKRPVFNLSWSDAQDYAAWLNNKLGIAPNALTRYRLPSEAEWEYACRAGSQTMWCFGDDKDELKEYAWYEDNSDGKTHPVGQKKPNAFGLYDMHGNVMEFVQDSRGGYKNAPTDGRARDGLKRPDNTSFWSRLFGLNKFEDILLRSGGAQAKAEITRSAQRIYASPSERVGAGFRLARTML